MLCQLRLFLVCGPVQLCFQLLALHPLCLQLLLERLQSSGQNLMMGRRARWRGATGCLGHGGGMSSWEQKWRSESPMHAVDWLSVLRGSCCLLALTDVVVVTAVDAPALEAAVYLVAKLPEDRHDSVRLPPLLRSLLLMPHFDAGSQDVLDTLKVLGESAVLVLPTAFEGACVDTCDCCCCGCCGFCFWVP